MSNPNSSDFLAVISRITNDKAVCFRMEQTLKYYETLEDNTAAKEMLEIVKKFYMFCALTEEVVVNESIN